MRGSRLAALLLAACAAPVLAETVPEEHVALGWQTEHAEVVAVATVAGDAAPAAEGRLSVELRVEEALVGGLSPGATAVAILDDHGIARRWRRGERVLAFLVPADGALYEPLTGAFGLRAIDGAGPESRLPEVVRSLALALRPSPGTPVLASLTDLLVGLMEDPDPGIAWSAAVDFVRHEELHDGLSEQHRLRIADAYRRQPFGKATKGALALAVAAARPSEGAAALVDSLLLPEAGPGRGAVAEALRRLADDRVPSLVAARIGGASPAAQRNLLVALGAACRGEEAAATARALLRSDAPEVRVEAAHALGRVARNTREGAPEARVDGLAELRVRVAAAQDPQELKALLWALVQLDQADAYALVREAAARHAEPAVRRYAEDLLERPRQSLLLR